MKREKKTTDDKSQTPAVKTQIPIIGENKSDFKLIAALVALLCLLTFASLFDTVDNELTNWDDRPYVLENKRLGDFSKENISAIFSEYTMGNYHPLAILSLSADYRLSKKDKDGNPEPQIFHLTNILLHVLTTVFVFFLVFRLFNNIYSAFFAALLFGVHTIHVESVAWISERKDVLYAFFFLSSLLSYLKYIETRKYAFYAFAIFLFLLSLLSKAQAVSLAVTLILLDFVKNEKMTSLKLWFEKTPFFILALVFGIIAVRAQQEGNAIVADGGYTLVSRMAIASYSYTQYLFDLLLPYNLSAFYPYPDIIHKTYPLWYWLGLITVFLSLFVIYKTYKTRKEIAFGLAFFIVNIVLLLQLIPVGSAIRADRYAYIPSIGFLIAFVFFANELLKNLFKKNTILYVGFSLYALMLIYFTVERNRVWKNSETLWNDTVEKSPGAVMAWNNRGSTLDKKAEKAYENQDFETAKTLRLLAISDFTKAIDGKPDYTHAFFNRGQTQYALGKQLNDTVLLERAISDFTYVLQTDSQFAEAYFKRGLIKDETGNVSGALADYNSALSIVPDNSGYYLNRGVLFGKTGELQKAVDDFSTALQINSNNESAFSNRGYAYFLLNRYELALEDYNKSIQLKPSDKAYLNRGILLSETGKNAEALRDFSAAIELNPGFDDAYLQRGIAFVQLSEKEKACDDFEKALQLNNTQAKKYLDKYCKK